MALGKFQHKVQNVTTKSLPPGHNLSLCHLFSHPFPHIFPSLMEFHSLTCCFLSLQWLSEDVDFRFQSSCCPRHISASPAQPQTLGRKIYFAKRKILTKKVIKFCNKVSEYLTSQNPVLTRKVGEY